MTTEFRFCDSLALRRVNGRATAPLLTVAALTVTQEPFGLAVIAPLAAVPLFTVLPSTSLLGAASTGFVVGTIYCLCTASWLLGAVSALGASPLAALAATLVICAWTKGIPFGIALLLIRALASSPSWARVGGAALVVFGLESVMQSGVSGEPLYLLGESQVGLPGVAQLAVIGGVPLISGLLIAINQAFALAVSRRSLTPLRVATGLAGGWAALALGGVWVCELVRPAVSEGAMERAIVLIQPNVPREQRWAPFLQETNLETLGQISERALEQLPKPVSLLIWPEMAIPLPTDVRAVTDLPLGRWIQRLRTPVLAGIATPTVPESDTSFRNSAVWLVPGVGAVDLLDKTRPLPLFESAPSGLLGLAAPLFGASVRPPWVEPGERERAMRGDFALAVTLCNEALYPRLVSSRRSEDSVAIVNLADDDWIRSEAFREQILDAVSFRAIEARQWLVRVSSRGPTAVFDPLGREVARLPIDQAGFLVAHVAASSHSLVSEGLALFLVFLCGVVAVELAGAGWRWGQR